MRWIAMLLPALAACVISTAGCATKKTVSTDPLGVAPNDFSIELTILTGPQAPPSNDAHLRQSRYVLFSDGSLHQGDDLEHAKGADWLPPLTRVVSRRQMAEIWSLVQQLGFVIEAPKRTDAVNFKMIAPSPDGLVYMAGFSGYGERWTFERPCAGSEPDPAMTQLTRELARLAWASDEAPADSSVMPRRYDFGPDPYERYKIPGAWPPEVNAKTKATTKPQGAQQ